MESSEVLDNPPAPQLHAFTRPQRLIIAGMRMAMSIVALTQLLVGILVAGFGALVALGEPLSGIPLLAIGIISIVGAHYLSKCTESLNDIGENAGQDIPPLLEAMRQVGRYYRFMALLAVIVFVYAIVSAFSG